jgi:hypothetical protein
MLRTLHERYNALSGADDSSRNIAESLLAKRRDKFPCTTFKTRASLLDVDDLRRATITNKTPVQINLA